MILPFVIFTGFIGARQTSQLSQDLNILYDAKEWSGSTLGCIVEDAYGNVLYSRNSDLRIVPASNNKLFAATFALGTLGPNYQPQTLIWDEPNAVIIKSTFDPLLSPAQLKDAAKSLHLDGRKPVKVWEAYRCGWNGSWELGDIPYDYTAQVNALTIDRGAFELKAINGKLQFSPNAYGNKIEWINRKSPQFSDTYDPWKHLCTVSGKLPTQNGTIDGYALPDPDILAANFLGRFAGYVQDVPNRTPDKIIEGQTLEKTIRLCLQISDNNIAENLLMLGASQGKRLEDPYPQALAKERTWLKENVGLTGNEVLLDDGSGLSRENSVQPAAIATLLRWHLNQPIADLWRSLLDYPGTGTLAHRMLNYPIQAKTGSMNRVSAISGYLNLPGQKTIIFSLIENNFNRTGHEAKLLEDEVMKTIAKDLKVGT